ncbi:hypothetical protein [Actinomadura chokoriensis]|uniref:Uncharacterized protein n=1 Tax=Actinomadura chokoriensis TaxID=454156 RepID=A0ABV4R172_9ACTN
MIILSGVLVVVAIALLVAGIVAGNGDSAQVFGLDALVVIYISIAVSIVSALCLAIGVFLRRKELWGPGASATPARSSKKAKAKKDKRRKAAPPAPAKNAAGAKGVPAATSPAVDPADDALEMPAPPVDVPDDALVFVVRGRKRYHLDTCRQLAGRDTEELTYAEAKEEGFSPCTACMPDTALAARAAASVPASPDDGGDASKAPGAGAREPGAERRGSGLAGLAEPSPAPASFDEPGAFDKPASFDRPASFDEPEAFDRTAEIPRADEPAVDPAGPTMTDVPVAGLFGKTAGTAPSAPEAAEEPEPAVREPEGRSAWDRPAEAASAEPDVTADLGPAPHIGSDAGAPKPRHAFEGTEDRAGDRAGKGAGEGEAPAAEPEPADEAEPAPSGGESAGEPAGDGPQVRILSGTKRYHRVDCALIEDIGDEADDLESLSRAEAKSRGCTACLVCQPDREHARD